MPCCSGFGQLQIFTELQVVKPVKVVASTGSVHKREWAILIGNRQGIHAGIQQ